jgi:hypothetical protein
MVAFMLNLKFKILRFIFSLATCALIAWLIAEATDADGVIAFLFLAIGMPIAVWLERLKNVPGHMLAAYVMNKELVSDVKKRLRKLPIKTAEEWNDFQSFYDDDQAIANHAANDPKAYAVATRYSLQTMRETGNFIDFMNSGLVCSKAVEEMFWDAQKKEEYDFVKSEGYESWAEYMVEHGTGEDVRESWKEAAKQEKIKREGKNTN